MHWKVWALLCTLTWAAWGVSVKFAIRGIGWQKLEIISALVGLLIMVIIAPSSFQMRSDVRNWYGLIAGILGALGTILFYISLNTGPISVIVPLTSLYVVGIAIAGVLIFGEPITVRKTIGVLLGIAAAILLAGEK